MENRQIEQSIAGAVMTSSAAYDHVIALCDRFGSRFGGTEGEAGARDYIAAVMARAGLEQVQAEPFPYTMWQRGHARIDVLDQDDNIRRTLACTALPYCPGGHVTGTLVDLGPGLPEEYDRRRSELCGAVVMAGSDTPASYPRWIHRREKYSRAQVNGAAAFLFMNHYPGMLTVTGSLRTDSMAPIPGVGITYEDGMWLRRAARDGALTLRVVTENSSGPGASWNVVGDLGPAADAPAILVGAHYDGHDISQGAVDDGTGVGVLLGAAQVLAPYAGRMKRRIRFVAFGVEELGLIGARRYADAHADELGALELMVNLDSAGDVGVKGIKTQAWPELGRYLADLCRGDGLDLPNADRISTSSDHFPFFLRGIPTAWIAKTAKSSGRGYGHTQADTADKVDPRAMQEATLATARFLWRLLTADDWPFRHRPVEIIKGLMEGAGMKEPAQLEDRWPFDD